jgi:hypothetical protein
MHLFDFLPPLPLCFSSSSSSSFSSCSSSCRCSWCDVSSPVSYGASSSHFYIFSRFLSWMSSAPVLTSSPMAQKSRFLWEEEEQVSRSRKTTSFTYSGWGFYHACWKSVGTLSEERNRCSLFTRTHNSFFAASWSMLYSSSSLSCFSPSSLNEIFIYSQSDNPTLSENPTGSS